MLCIIKCAFVIDLVAKFCPNLRAIIFQNMIYLIHVTKKTFMFRSSILLDFQ